MNYVQEKCLFNAVIIGECLKIKAKEALSRIVPCYPLSEKDQKCLQKYVSNQMFNRLSTPDAVQLHLNFISTFCKSSDMFGVECDQKRSLEIKLAALTLFKSLSLETGEVLGVLSKRAETDDKLSVALALMHILKGGKKNIYLPLLRRAEAHGYLEASIVLMNVEPERRRELYEKIQLNKELYLLADGTAESVAVYYDIKNC